MQEPLEQYVETVRIGLKRLPVDEREKEITELRQHLNALVQARSELGDTEETATASAIEQFGQASTVRRRLLAAFRRRRLAAFRRRRLAAFRHTWLGAVVCTVFTFCSVFYAVPVALKILIPYNPRNPANNQTVLLWYGYAMMFLQCNLMGWQSCLLTGRRCVPVLACISIWFNLRYIVPQFVRGPYSYDDWRFLIIVASASLVLTLLAAYFSLRQSQAFRRA